MKKTLLLIPILSVSLLGCNQPTQTSEVQPVSIAVETVVQNEEVAAKPNQNNQTKTTSQTSKNNTTYNNTKTNNNSNNNKNNNTNKATSTTSNASVKDVIIDGYGNLVVAKSNGTFATFQPLKGDIGPIGPKGDKGDRGEQGESGRGIDHCELDADKNLIVHYTDGTSQNVGCVAIAQEDNTPNHEKIGYQLNNNFSYPIESNVPIYGSNMCHHVFNVNCNIKIKSLSVQLIDIDNNNPSNKYKYKVTMNYSIENFNSLCCSEDNNTYSTSILRLYLFPFSVKIDNSINVPFNCTSATIDTLEDYTLELTMFSSVPYVSITNCEIATSLILWGPSPQS